MANPVTRIIIGAKDEATAVVDGIRGRMKIIAAAIAGYFSFRLFSDAVASAADFEEAMSRVQAASDASAEEMQQLEETARQVGATTKYNATEAALALEELAKAGLSAQDAAAALPAVLNLAQAGGVELGTAAEYITKSVNGMGLSFAEAGRVADVLAKGANASQTSVDGLAQALSYAAPLANSLGLSLEETVAIIGKFADGGIDASRAGTALNSVLAQFNDPASKFRKELAAAGISSGNFSQALRQLADAGPAGQKAINAVGQEAGPALRSLLNQGMGALGELTASLQNASGSAAATAATMGNNFNGALARLSSAWDGMRTTLVAPLLAPLADQAEKLARKFSDIVSSGTLDKFGALLKTAFSNAIVAAERFFASFDSEAIVAKLEGFAASAGSAFASITQYAQNAAGGVKLAYGVMSAGFNTLLSVIYRFGQGMSWMTSALLADLASISAGISKITFGDLSKGFADAAVAMRIEAQAAYSVYEEFGNKAGEAFAAAGQGAEIVAEAWQEVGGSTKQAAEQSAVAIDALGEKSKTTAERIAELTAERERMLAAGDTEGAARAWTELVGLHEKAAQEALVVAVAQRKVRVEVEETRQQTRALEAAYRDAVAEGDWQRAAEIMRQLGQETNVTGGAARQSASDFEQQAKATQEQARTSEALFKMLGNERAAMWANIAAKRQDIAITKAKSAAAVADARETLKSAQASLDDAEARGANADAARDQVEQARLLLAERLKEQNLANESVQQTEIEIQTQIRQTNQRKGDNQEIQNTGAAANQASDGVKNLNQATSQGASLTEIYMRIWEKALSSIGRVSDSAREAVESVANSQGAFTDFSAGVNALSQSALDFVRDDPLGDMRGQATQLDQQIEATTAKVREFSDINRVFTSGLGFVEFNQAIASMKAFELSLLQAKKQLLDLDLAVETFNASVEAGEIPLAQQERQLAALVRQAERLGSQQLTGLRSALKSVSDQLRTTRDDASDTLDAIEDRIDEMHGKYTAIEKRRADNERAELQTKLDQARAEGNQDAVAKYQKALARLKELEAQALADAREREKQEQADRAANKDGGQSGRTGGSTGGNSTGSGTAGGQGGGTGHAGGGGLSLPIAPTQVVQLNINLGGGRTHALYTSKDTAEAFVRELERAASVSSYR